MVIARPTRRRTYFALVAALAVVAIGVASPAARVDGRRHAPGTSIPVVSSPAAAIASATDALPELMHVSWVWAMLPALLAAVAAGVCSQARARRGRRASRARRGNVNLRGPPRAALR